MWWLMGDVEANWYHATAEAAVPTSSTVIVMRCRIIVVYCKSHGKEVNLALGPKTPPKTDNIQYY